MPEPAKPKSSKAPISRFTWVLVTIGILLGACLSLLSTHWESGSVPNVLLLTVGSGVIATALISLMLDLFWSKERAEAEGEVLKPFLDKFEGFTNQLGKLEGRLEAFKLLGFNYCYASRIRALERFREYALEVIASGATAGAPEKTIDVVSSSARGLTGYLDRIPDEIQKEWRSLIAMHPERFRFLLTHPAYAHLRQPAEERSSGDIELEILKAAVFLHCVAGMNADHLRFYRGSPTVFAIQADTHILLNPYPYGQMAMETLCLEFESEDASSYVAKFMGKHFRHTWAFFDQPSKRVDGKPLVEGVTGFDNILQAFGECTFLGSPKRLRLTEAQVDELDTFTTRTLARDYREPRINPPSGAPFKEFATAQGLSYTDPEEGAPNP